MSKDIYEAVRTEIKSKLPEKKAVDGQVVETNRDDILQAVPYYVKMAVMKLQEQEVIPPRHKTIDPEEEKEFFVNKKGKEVFAYVKLPDNYSSMDTLKVSGLDTDPKWHDDEYSIEKKAKLYDRVLYKITKIHIGEGSAFQNVLVMSDFDKGEIFLKYFMTGTEDNLHLIEERCWPSIISEVLARVGLGSERRAMMDATGAKDNRKDGGRVGFHGRTKGRYFGRTSYKRRRRI